MFVIFGAGQVGLQAFRYFYTKGTCILIDQNPLEWYHPTIRTISNIRQIPIDQIQTESEFNHWENNSSFTGFHYFIQGEISVLNALLEIIVPQYLIPAAPIHVMGELFKNAIMQEWPNASFLPHKILSPSDKKSNFPTELNIHQTADFKVYLSYAKEFEHCLDNCFGPKGYCPQFHRTKPITVSDFINQFFHPESNFFHFISTQITAGLGGISYNDLKNYINRVLELLKHPKLDENYTIATSCNCHGVIEQYRVSSKG